MATPDVSEADGVCLRAARSGLTQEWLRHSCSPLKTCGLLGREDRLRSVFNGLNELA